MNIAILGFANQGHAAYNYWNKPGNKLTICDQDQATKVPDGAASQLGKDYLSNLDKFDLLVRTPSLHPSSIVKANSPDILSKITTVTDEFFTACPGKNIIGVTGTKGKGTTSTLITKILEASGKTVHLGGNIGTPPLDLLKNNIQPDDWVVLELANFQLIDLKHSPHIALCLMVVPEHLDWHKDYQEYLKAKQRLFIDQDVGDIAVYYASNEDSKAVASVSTGQLIPYMESPGAVVLNNKISIDGNDICQTNDIKLPGAHNWQNICAAITATWQIVQDINAIKSVVTSFSGLEHRLELVREINGVSFYDDSFGTTPETAQVAIEAFDKPKVIILGGSDKGANYDELAKTVVKGNVRSVVVVGKTGPAISSALTNAGFTNIVDGGSTMEQIVKAATEQAKSGDIVLLSTACASFDLFKNYKDRGEQFASIVNGL